MLEPLDAALAVTRRLHPRRVPVDMVGRRSWFMRTRFATSHFVGGLPLARDEWLACLSELARDGNGVLIPGSDPATEFVVKERSRIPERLRSFEAPGSAHLKLMDKASLYAHARDVGVRVPWTLQLGSRAELDRVLAEARYPCLLKPAVAHHWRRMFGEWRVLFLHGPDDLVREAGPALDAGLELLVTEHVPGNDRHLEGVTVIRDSNGSYPLAYGRRKVRAYPPGFGTASILESADVPETMDLTARLLDAAGFVGIAAAEVKRHAHTGERMLIEINVRIPRGFALGDACGVDASWRLYAVLAGIPLRPQPPARSGVKVVVPSMEPRAAVASLMRRRLTLRELLASYRGVRSLSGLSLRDPAPSVWFSIRQFRHGRRFGGRRQLGPSSPESDGEST
jgi:predicted ATP-grasp superfamily ATP-dependent carboligase